jgi:hypothetical protein
MMWLKASLVLVVLWGGAYSAAAYYDPGVQRWINRDPLGDIGSLPVMVSDAAPWADSDYGGGGIGESELNSFLTQINANLYATMGNDPLNQADSFGECAGAIALPAIGGAGEALGIAGLGAVGVPASPPNFQDPRVMVRLTTAATIALAKAYVDIRIWMGQGERIKTGEAAEQLEDIERAQDKAKKRRPETKGPNADPDWVGEKRPKQHDVDGTNKSRQRARAEDYGCQ